MKIFEIFASASALQSPFFAHPCLGNPRVCTGLHRLVFPGGNTNLVSVYGVYDDEGIYHVPRSLCGPQQNGTSIITTAFPIPLYRQSPEHQIWQHYMLDVLYIRFLEKRLHHNSAMACEKKSYSGFFEDLY